MQIIDCDIVIITFLQVGEGDAKIVGAEKVCSGP